ncbi:MULTISPECIES: S1C family serine protease [Deinococcus]|uniref:Serine protease n=2 Tax=Deinococcus TaxID=1298 RepID=A0AAV4K551_9DEIO|nr:trypsin-like peptidase domain-containing protein [Deinococcus wulumuqiensis]UVZ00219.1 HtrA protease/chaperone protein [synthetic construct]GGI86297.1 serine protease [Deinococcus wulumuqiensis]GGP30958.1 serine protease [Deinococcus wulumuqiensis]
MKTAMPILTLLLLLAGCTDPTESRTQTTSSTSRTATTNTAPGGAARDSSSPSGPAGQTASPDQGRLEYDQNTIDVVKDTQDGVVFVTRFDQSGGGALFSESPLAPDAAPEDQEGPTGSGSGFLIDREGHILTNYHVIQDATDIRIRLHQNERDYPASVVGTAPAYDLALLRAEAVPADLEPMRLGDSDRLLVGEKAIALGAPFGLEFTVTQGIISAVKRVIPMGVESIPQNSVQTDAAINPGNSGGPLVNSRGEVVGVNTQILSPAGAVTGVGQNAGVGFAIPVNVVKSLLPRLRAGEEITVPRIGIVSVNLQALTPSAREALGLPEQGVLVQSVEPGTPAAAAGLRGGPRSQRFPDGDIRLGGDIITAVDGQEVSTVQDLQGVLLGKQSGDEVILTLRRDGQTLQRKLTLS